MLERQKVINVTLTMIIPKVVFLSFTQFTKPYQVSENPAFADKGPHSSERQKSSRSDKGSFFHFFLSDVSYEIDKLMNSGPRFKSHKLMLFLKLWVLPLHGGRLASVLWCVVWNEVKRWSSMPHHYYSHCIFATVDGHKALDFWRVSQPLCD